MNTILCFSVLLLVFLLPTSLFASSIGLWFTCDELREMGICIEPADPEMKGTAA